jgi:hypothetical protein
MSADIQNTSVISDSAASVVTPSVIGESGVSEEKPVELEVEKDAPVGGMRETLYFENAIIKKNSLFSDSLKDGVFGIIYKCVCSPNGKLYFGRTIQSLERRIIGHFCDARKSCKGIRFKFAGTDDTTSSFSDDSVDGYVFDDAEEGSVLVYR